MRVGIMEFNIDVKRGDGNFLDAEAKRICKFLGDGVKQYEFMKTGEDEDSLKYFRRNVLYQYITDCMLEKYPQLAEEYQFFIDDTEKNIQKRLQDNLPSWDEFGRREYEWGGLCKAEKKFVCYCDDYLRELEEPGTLEREQEKADRQKALQQAYRIERERHPKIECPYCHSTNTEKIGTVSRAVSISVAGVASSKIGKQWHCKNCGSDF